MPELHRQQPILSVDVNLGGGGHHLVLTHIHFSLFAAVLARQAVTGNFDNVITDGFPTGLPAGTPLGVKIALASTQQREYPRKHEQETCQVASIRGHP